MKVYCVFENGICKMGPVDGQECYDILTHVCETMKVAKTYIEAWAKQNNGCYMNGDGESNTDGTDAICYYDDDRFWGDPDIAPCTYEDYLKVDERWGGYRSIYIKEMLVETEGDAE